MQATPNPYEDLMIKAAKDEAFREALLADPKAALEAHLGTRLPEELTVKVITNTPRELTLVIPPKMTDELSDAQLEGVAGGQRDLTETDADVMYSFMTFGVGCANSAIRLGSVKSCRDEWAKNFQW